MNGNVVAANNNYIRVNGKGKRSESVSRNSCTPSPIANENALVDKTCNSVSVNGNGTTVIDLLDLPYGNIERALTAKIRNLEKRRLKLQQKSEAASKGAALTNEQREALLKAGEVEQQIEYVKDLTKLLEKQQKLYQRARKDALRKKNMKATTAAVNGATPTPPPSEADMPAQTDANKQTESNGQSKTTTEVQMEFQLDQPGSELVKETLIESRPTETIVNGNENIGNCEPPAKVVEQLENELVAKSEEKPLESVVTEHDKQTEVALVDNLLTHNVEQVVENGDVPSVNVTEPTQQEQPVSENTIAVVETTQTNDVPTEPHSVAEQANNVAPQRSDKQNRRSSHHNPQYRRNGPFQGRQQHYGVGKNYYTRNSRSRYHNGQRNGGYHSNENTENNNGDASAESGEGGFVKPTTFVRRRNVDGYNNENNNTTENGEVAQNGHYRSNGYHNSRSTYRKHRAHSNQDNGIQNGGENNAPAVENRGDILPGEQNENDGYVSRQRYYNNNNGYRGSSRHYNENNRLFRPRPNYNNGGNRNYDNNYERKDRSHYYKHTATHRQPLECGFVFTTD